MADRYLPVSRKTKRKTQDGYGSKKFVVAVVWKSELLTFFAHLCEPFISFAGRKLHGSTHISNVSSNAKQNSDLVSLKNLLQ